MKITSSRFGELEGKEVIKFTLANESGTKVDVISYGGIITTFEVPDHQGQAKNIALGFDNLDQYREDHSFLGAIIGRCCNRVAYGKFQLNGQSYQLPVNLPPHHLHGGVDGFAKRLWEPEVAVQEGLECLKLKYHSPHGEEGYPGNLEVEVIYCLNQHNELSITYRAQCDRDTMVNLTNHTYFNLNGRNAPSCLDHEIQCLAKYYLPVNETSIPLGNPEPVKDTPFDFSTYGEIGEKMRMTHPQTKIGQGFDHHLVKEASADPEALLWARHPGSGIQLTVKTTQPGFQFYTGNFLSDSSQGKFNDYQGFCVETQNYPDGINQPSFPSPVLRAKEVYEEETVFVIESAGLRANPKAG